MRGEETVPEATLLEAAQRAGFTVSRPQLKRLRREGLLQPATQQHRIGRRGSETRYPTAAVGQLVGVLAIQRRRRSFEAVRFLAWEQGLWVEHSQMRATLTRWVRLSVHTTQHLGRAETRDVALSRLAIRIAQDQGAMNAAARDLLRRAPTGATREDVVFAGLQLASGSPDVALSSDLLDEVTGFPELTAAWGVDADLVDTVARLRLPPSAQYPRLVSRASRTQIAAGREYLQGLRVFTAQSPIPGEAMLTGDTDAAIQYRAGHAAMGIIVTRHTRSQRATNS